MKTRLLILLISILFADCSSRDRVPNSILKPSKMEAVFWDIVRADQVLNEKAMRGDSLANTANTRIRLYRQVFQIHNITKEKFQKSFSFYRTHPGLLKLILDSLNGNIYTAPTEMVLPKPSTSISVQ